MSRVLLAVSLALLSACAERESYTETADGLPLLMGEFLSYSSEQQVRAALASWPIHDFERSGLDKGDKRPPFNQVTLTVNDYSHVGHSGELQLHLFNDRLMNVWFYPVDADEYLAALRGRGVAIATEDSRTRAGPVRIWTQRDHLGNRVYVGWTDWRLQDQSARWIARYS